MNPALAMTLPPAPSCSISALCSHDLAQNVLAYLKTLTDITCVYGEAGKDGSSECPEGARNRQLIETRFDQSIAFIAIDDRYANDLIKMLRFDLLHLSGHYLVSRT
jgi:hypothetical protein